MDGVDRLANFLYWIAVSFAMSVSITIFKKALAVKHPAKMSTCEATLKSFEALFTGPFV